MFAIIQVLFVVHQNVGRDLTRLTCANTTPVLLGTVLLRQIWSLVAKTEVVPHQSPITRVKVEAAAAAALVALARAVAAALEAMTMPIRAVVDQMDLTMMMETSAVQASHLEGPPIKSKTLEQLSTQCRMLLVDFSSLACSRLSY